MELAEVRRALKLSQEEIGQTLDQPGIGRQDREADKYVCHRFIKAMGGELEIVARFGNHVVKIRNCSDLNERERA